MFRKVFVAQLSRNAYVRLKTYLGSEKHGEHCSTFKTTR